MLGKGRKKEMLRSIRSISRARGVWSHRKKKNEITPSQLELTECRCLLAGCHFIVMLSMITFLYRIWRVVENGLNSQIMALISWPNILSAESWGGSLVNKLDFLAKIQYCWNSECWKPRKASCNRIDCFGFTGKFGNTEYLVYDIDINGTAYTALVCRIFGKIAHTIGVPINKFKVFYTVNIIKYEFYKISTSSSLDLNQSVYNCPWRC